MKIPPFLEEAIEKEILKVPFSELQRLSHELSSLYLNKKKISALHEKAFLTTRFPATFASVFSVLSELKKRVPGLKINHLLDLGAGPGTTMWASLEIFPDIEEFSLFEMEPWMIELGKRLSLHHANKAVREAKWWERDLTKEVSFDPADLVILSYSIGELALEKGCLLLETLNPISHPYLILLEPGTPASFERMCGFRKLLLEKDWKLIAPCPHSEKCPLKGNDWCHFSARLERTSFHRSIKQGTLGYEDEKFFYLIFGPASKECNSRIIRHPMKYPKNYSFTLCTKDGIKNINITKKQKQNFKEAKKLKWGDLFHLNTES